MPTDVKLYRAALILWIASGFIAGTIMLLRFEGWPFFLTLPFWLVERIAARRVRRVMGLNPQPATALHLSEAQFSIVGYGVTALLVLFVLIVWLAH